MLIEIPRPVFVQQATCRGFIAQMNRECVKIPVNAGGSMVGGMAVSHVAHLGGALAGVLLVVLLHQLSDKPSLDKPPIQKIA